MNGDDTSELEWVEAEAFAGLFPEYCFTLGQAVGIVHPQLQVLMFNRVIGLGVGRPASDADLDEIAERFGVREHMISVAPGAQPGDLADRLRERGYRPGYAWVKFRRGAIAPAPVATSLRVERIGPDRAEDFARVVTEGFGMPEAAGEPLAAIVGQPGWACFLAFADDVPAAGGLVHTNSQAAWLGAAATLPEYRRRGGQGAIMVERIRYAMQQGCRRVVTETGEVTPGGTDASYRNILRHGFEPAYVRPNFVSPEPTFAA